MARLSKSFVASGRAGGAGGRPQGPKCRSCQVPFDKHLGLEGTCANELRLAQFNKDLARENARLSNEVARLKPENHALLVLIEDAKKSRALQELEISVVLKENLRLTRECLYSKTVLAAFKTLMYLSPIPPNQEANLQNLLAALKSFRTGKGKPAIVEVFKPFKVVAKRKK